MVTATYWVTLNNILHLYKLTFRLNSGYPQTYPGFWRTTFRTSHAYSNPHLAILTPGHRKSLIFQLTPDTYPSDWTLLIYSPIDSHLMNLAKRKIAGMQKSVHAKIYKKFLFEFAFMQLNYQWFAVNPFSVSIALFYILWRWLNNKYATVSTIAAMLHWPITLLIGITMDKVHDPFLYIYQYGLLHAKHLSITTTWKTLTRAKKLDTTLVRKKLQRNMKLALLQLVAFWKTNNPLS